MVWKVEGVSLPRPVGIGICTGSRISFGRNQVVSSYVWKTWRRGAMICNLNPCFMVLLNRIHDVRPCVKDEVNEFGLSMFDGLPCQNDGELHAWLDTPLGLGNAQCPCSNQWLCHCECSHSSECHREQGKRNETWMPSYQQVSKQVQITWARKDYITQRGFMSSTCSKCSCLTHISWHSKKGATPVQQLMHLKLGSCTIWWTMSLATMLWRLIGDWEVGNAFT